MSLYKYLINLKQSKFVRNVFAVATGIAAAQAISLAFMPFLTRLYGPEAFGALAAFTAILNTITPLATLGYANAIVMPKTEEGANAVARLSLVSAVIVSPIALIIVYIFQSQLAILVGLESEPNLLYLIPISLVLVALLSVANQVAIRDSLFKVKSGSYVLSNFIINLGKLGAGYISASGITLIVLSIFANLINYIILMARVPKDSAFDFRQWFGITGIRKAAFEHKDFAIYRMPQSIINAVTLGLPVILLSNFFGPAAAGQYSLTVLVLGAPIMLLGQSIGEVFYPKITQAIINNEFSAKKILIKSTLILALCSLVIFLPVIFLGSITFPLIFGEEWFRAGEYAQWISIWLIGVLTSRTCVAAFPVLKLQKYLLIQEVISVILRTSVLYIGFKYFESDLIAIALFSLVGFFLTISMILITYIRLRHQLTSNE